MPCRTQRASQAYATTRPSRRFIKRTSLSSQAEILRARTRQPRSLRP
jgi:hypothetical protein